MRTLRKTTQFAVLSLFTAIIGSTAIASPLKCQDAFENRSSALAPVHLLTQASNLDWNARRDAVVEFLKAHPEVPSYLKETERGLVPVVLLNEHTHPALAPLLANSISYGFLLSPGGSDHAMLRVEGTMMDNGHPNTRRGGEVNNTGLAWKELGPLLPWRQKMIQNSYLMPDADRATAKFYQLVRGAAFFRVRYSFANDWELDRVTPNLIEEVQENCFRFCKSDQTPQMLVGIRSRLTEALGSQVDALRSSSELREVIGRARAEILKTDINDPLHLNWYSAKKIARLSGFNRLLPKNLNERQREAVVNLFISERAVEDYINLLKTYRVSDHHGYQDIDAGAVTFTIIMDNMDAADKFRRGEYEAHGQFFHWLPEAR